MEHLYEKALESAEYIKAHTTKRPKVAVVLGSGLGKPDRRLYRHRGAALQGHPQLPGIHSGRAQRRFAGRQTGQKKKSMLWKAASRVCQFRHIRTFCFVRELCRSER